MHKSKTNHNYPKNRKPRDTSYSVTQKILKSIGKDNLFELWKKNGHRKTAKILTETLGIYVSTMIIQYISARKYKWQREITDKNFCLYKAYLNGKVDANEYKTIIFK